MTRHLYGLKEIAAEIGERPGTVSAWQTRGTNEMPPPDQRLSAGPVWFAGTIEPWMKAHFAGWHQQDSALGEDFLKRLLRRHLRATALLLEGPPRRPTLIAHALKDLEEVAADCARAAGEAHGPLAQALRDEAELIDRLDDVRRRTEEEMSRANAQRRRRRDVSPSLDRSHRLLTTTFMKQAASLSAAIADWLDADSRNESVTAVDSDRPGGDAPQDGVRANEQRRLAPIDPPDRARDRGPANRTGLVVVHADWGKDPSKRWIARARRTDGGWSVETVKAWRSDGSPLERLGLAANEPGPILIGVDFPIGLPSAYARAAGVTSFRDTLPLLGGPGWEQFYEVAHTADEISLTRPFYPYASTSEKEQQHLVDGLKIPVEGLRRACENRTPTHPAACPLFWTLGANQVGKGAITGWQELVVPLITDEAAAIWPFDGDIAELVASSRVTIAETYPTEYYGPLGFKKGRKQLQSVRMARGEMILKGAADLGATVAPKVKTLIRDGFGKEPGGEDPFDAVVGLIGMLTALHTRAEAPRDDPIRTMEGWILGQPVG